MPCRIQSSGGWSRTPKRQETADVSAAEAASLLEISRVSARRYLEHLTETGKVEVALRYGEVGRPERRYAWR